MSNTIHYTSGQSPIQSNEFPWVAINVSASNNSHANKTRNRTKKNRKNTCIRNQLRMTAVIELCFVLGCFSWVQFAVSASCSCKELPLKSYNASINFQFCLCMKFLSLWEKGIYNIYCAQCINETITASSCVYMYVCQQEKQRQIHIK